MEQLTDSPEVASTSCSDRLTISMFNSTSDANPYKVCNGSKIAPKDKYEKPGTNTNFICLFTSCCIPRK